MYERHGVGSLVVELRETGEALGICGLIKRDSLEHMDIGFAFLPQHRAKGYALESAAACMEHGRRVLGQERIVAIVTAENGSSVRLLEKLGMRFEKTVTMPGETEELQLYAT